MNLIPIWARVVVMAMLTVAALWALEAWKTSLRAEGYSKAQVEYQQKLLLELSKAAEKTRQMEQKVKEAEDAAREQAKVHAAALARANAVAGELRGTLKLYRDSLPGLSLDASRSLADRGLRLLGDCQERYIWMADRAASRAGYIRTLKASWPEGVK